MNAAVLVLLYVVYSVFVVQCNPLLRTVNEASIDIIPEHKLSKRFINPSMTSGGFSTDVLSKIRAKRDLEEECEKLRLCKLHAESSRSFIASFELYFVNKENARLWDHRAHSSSECDQRYSCYR